MAEPRIQRLTCSSGQLASFKGGVVAIGNFDGVHRGHQQVLTSALQQAEILGAPSLVLTFEPHPRSVFRPEVPLFRITPPELRARLLEASGFDAVVEQPFTGAFAAFDAEAFVRDVLVRDLGIRHVVTGYDFHFGKDRQGSPEFLIEAGKRYGFGVSLVAAFRDECAQIVSSSRIRSLLTDGEVAEAAGLLGYRFTIESVVQHGRKLGRELGFPTANMALEDSCTLKEGIYAVRLRRADGTLHNGVASFGRRPTVTDDGAPLLETYVFDFSDDLYGETCAVSFFGYLRGELKFDGLDDLIVQMKQDEAEARALLAGAKPLSDLDRKISFEGI
ncbi:bifunctional riboflavin kinase/FAD synthetase [Aerobium aerolatum]|uniref:Riboflavin biosynthesis protein n=1 Tax=Aquamicrobium aerolatum DSM 21857 TaxID=1121003 RepID=A0A1I3HGD0_9HYPH|nr:bifunctional riboflavin kinase/FAD synthetase [Aquamicrobium aerolatum]SFI34828.1 riboflavin kinase / FMN adenylyltransferase [Aquamicrobium aerolatum DSM 21857]